MMKVFKTVVSNGMTVLPIDTISHEGGLWLVPHWIVTPDGQCLMPDRMIRIDLLSLRKLQPRDPWDYHLLDCVPDQVLIGPLAAGESSSFEIIDRPRHIMREIGSFDS